MSELDRYFHEVWLGMVQPIDGLVVSIPVLVDAQCMERQPPHVQQKLLSLCGDGPIIADLAQLLSELLGLTPALFDAGDALPDDLALYVPEGRQTLRPTMALRKQGAAGHELLVWELPAGLDLDRPETVTGTWDYPPSAKLDRLLRHTRVPIGLLTNREVLRLIYAPHGESSGAITFRLEDMASVGGRPILDAFVMLLSANRFFGVAPERALPALLADSRTRQANVTNDLADQVFEALQILLRGFESAAERDGRALLDDALGRDGDHLYKGLLTVLLRLVFLLYAEDRALLPVEQPVYADHVSVLALFAQLQADRGAYPDSMSRRFGAWGRLVAGFRAIFLGVEHGPLKMPARRGSLFNPQTYPFLEGWGPEGSAPITQPEDRAAVRLPTVDDETIYRVLEKLLVLDGQRLSYRALDVEQIGSVYEALMGYHAQRVPAPAVCLKPDRVWLTAAEVLEQPAARRAKWLKETIGLSTAQAEKLNDDLKTTDPLEALARYAAGGRKGDPALSKARAGQLVLQPGAERRRTSSHYTPRSLSAPIVKRTLEPLLAVMGDAPASERILNLKVCDPAMGSGAFLVEACRFLADQVLAAWTREGKTEALAKEHGDPLLHARRVVAQRCLYGVDKNEAAVELAKLSLWLVTLSKTLPFTFLDHSLRHGDSLVGLDFEQIRNFHWKVPDKKPSAQLDLFGREIAVALDDAIQLRQLIGTLGDSPVEDREKARLFWDAQDALDRIRLISDLVVGAFFAHDKDKDRETERAKREAMVRDWLLTGSPPTRQLLEMQLELHASLSPFHWMVEFPEVFYAERPDPLDQNQACRAAHMDAFVGNPPFAGKNAISEIGGAAYIPWLQAIHVSSHGNADLCAHFFRRAAHLIGDHGSIGLLGTNTIAQGDTRRTGLQPMLAMGFQIYHANENLTWPGEAAVIVSAIHLGAGTIAATTSDQKELNGTPASSINSHLRIDRERPEPHPLARNSGLTLVGCFLAGSGFVLEGDEAAILVRADPANSSVIRPFLGGEDFNRNPRQDSSRFVIDFGELDYGAAKQWPQLLSLVEQRVRPDRAKARHDRREYWWLFAGRAPRIKSYLDENGRILAVAQTAPHYAFAFVPSGTTIANTLIAFLMDGWTPFAILQSRIHEPWTRLLSSSLAGTLRYSPSDCFETFPFPRSDPREAILSVDCAAKHLHNSRAKYMTEQNIGLTATYNRLKDLACIDAQVLESRSLHEQMDRAVLDAYGWTDIEVPPYCPMNDEDRQKVSKFENEVIDRLFALNAKRAEEERIAGLGAPGAKKPKKASAAKKPRAKKGAPQLTFGEPATEPDADDD